MGPFDTPDRPLDPPEPRQEPNVDHDEQAKYADQFDARDSDLSWSSDQLRDADCDDLCNAVRWDAAAIIDRLQAEVRYQRQLARAARSIAAQMAQELIADLSRIDGSSLTTRED